MCFRFSLRTSAYVTALLGIQDTCVACGLKDGRVQLWDIASETLIREQTVHGRHVVSLQYVTERGVVASSSGDGTAAVLDLELKLLLTTAAVARTVTMVAWTAQCLYTSSADGCLRMYPFLQAQDVPLQAQCVVRAHDAACECVRRVGNVIMSGGDDSMVCVWSTSLEPLARVHVASPVVAACVYSETTLLVGLFDRSIRRVDICVNTDDKHNVAHYCSVSMPVALLSSGLMSLYLHNNDVYVGLAPIDRDMGMIDTCSALNCNVYSISSLTLAFLSRNRVAISNFKRVQITNPLGFSQSVR